MLAKLKRQIHRFCRKAVIDLLAVCRPLVLLASLLLAPILLSLLPASAQAGEETKPTPSAVIPQPISREDQGLSPEATPRRPYRIYIISHRSNAVADDGFIEYFKSRNIPVDFIRRSTDGHNDLIPGFVQEIHQIKPDLVFTLSTDVALGVLGTYDKADPQKNITDIPVVFTLVGDPVGSRIVHSLDAPGRNATGTVHLVPVDVQLRAMQSYNPSTQPLQRLGVIYNPLEAYGQFMIKELRRLTKEQGIKLIEATPLNAEGRPDKERIAPAIAEIAEQKADLLYVPATNFFGPHSRLLTEEAVKRKLPVFAAIEVQLVNGKGLMGLVSPFYLVGQFAAFKAEQILVNKIPPGQIPVETLKRFSLIINMGVAKELGMYPPINAFRFAQIGPN